MLLKGINTTNTEKQSELHPTAENKYFERGKQKWVFQRHKNYLIHHCFDESNQIMETEPILK